MLAVAPSRLFRVYYFRLYLALILLGAFVGLAALPVFLSYWGPASPASRTRVHTYREDDGDGDDGESRGGDGDGAAAAVVRRRRRRRRKEQAGAGGRKGD